MRKLLLATFMIACFGMLFAFLFVPTTGGEAKTVPASEFISLVESGTITDVLIEGNEVRGTGADKTVRITTATDKTELLRVMSERKTKYSERVVSPGIGSIFLSLLPFMLMIAVLFFLMKGLSGAIGNAGKAAKAAGKSKAVKHEATTGVTFANVAGADEAIADSKELVEFLKNPAKFQRLGGKMPRGCLFLGESGVGKTLLARAIAGEAGVPFFSTAASEFIEMFVGVGASRVRDLFEQARKAAPCIVFIDEIDAVAKQRGGLAMGGGNDEREQTLNQILVEMDGFEQSAGVIVIGATNRPEVLDSAILRPGRFDRKITVPRPDINGRVRILEVHAKGRPLHPSVDLREIARSTPGMTGADLANLLNEAALMAARSDQENITMLDILRSRDKVMAGDERKGMVISPEEKLTIAVHEAGHTIVGWFNPHSTPVHRVSIIPRGGALGLTWMIPEQDRYLQTQAQMLASIQGLYGGRAAELIAFGTSGITNGASNDLQRLTAIAKAMVTDWAMTPTDEGTGQPPRVYGKKETGMVFSNSERDYGDETSTTIDKRVNVILRRCWEDTMKVLKEKRDLLDRVTHALLEKETLEQADLVAILGPRAQAVLPITA